MLATIFLLFFPAIDIGLQNLFFDFSHHAWIVDRHNPIFYGIFYQIPKMLIIAAGATLFILLILVKIKKIKISSKKQKALVIAIFYMALLPSLVGSLKKITDIPCPKELNLYGGELQHIPILNQIFSSYQTGGRCFPAGHVSGGFALYALLFLLSEEQKKKRITVAFIGITIWAWIMGLYQIARGEHFFSHTFVTQAIAAILFLLALKFFDKSKIIKNSI